MAAFRWMKTDTATIMFSALTTKTWGRTFRFSADLNVPVDPELLRRAAADVLPQYPSVMTSLRKGFFWSYQVVTSRLPQIRAEGSRPLQPITALYKGLPDFRIVYGERSVSLEASHSVGDGRGLSRVFRELLARYAALAEGETAPYTPVAPPEATCVNAFDEYYEKGGEKPAGDMPRAYHFHEHYTDDYIKLLYAETSSSAVKELAHARGMTVTEYLCAVLILGVLQTASSPIREPITIAVPVDLRRFFKTGSYRNFTVQAYVTYDPAGKESHTLDGICAATFGTLKAQLTAENLQKSLNKYGAAKTNPVLRVVPYAIKKPVLSKMQRNSHGQVTTIFTNLGERTLPPALDRIVERLRFVNGDTRRYGLPVTCSCVTFHDKLTLCFSRANRDTCWFDACVTILREQGLPVETDVAEGAAPPEDPGAVPEKTPFSSKKLRAFFSL